MVKLSEEEPKPADFMSLVRSDIREELTKWQTEGQELQRKFLSENPPVGIDLQDFAKRSAIGDQRFIKGESTAGLISYDEILYSSKLSRYICEEWSKSNIPIPEDITITSFEIEGIPVEWQDCGSPDRNKVILYFHGGGWTAGCAKNHRIMTFPIGRLCKARVLSVDYRLAPEHPFPAQLEDALSTYEFLIDNSVAPSNIMLMGISAGGGLSLSLLAKIKEVGLDFPAGAVLKSPGLDMSRIYTSYGKNAAIDAGTMAGLFMCRQAYIGDAEPTNPLISPIYADLNGFPPLLIQVGTNEVLYDQCKQLEEKAKAAGVDTTLQEFQDMVHTWHFMDIPEASEAFEKIGEFVRARFAM